jgi:hypothetical protein
VVEPLRRMGAEIAGRRGGELAPLAISGRRLKGAAHSLAVALGTGAGDAREAGPIERSDHDPIGLDAQVEASHVGKARHEQPGSDEQDDGERRLRDRER